MSISSLAPATITLGFLASTASAGSFWENGVGGLAWVTFVSPTAAETGPTPTRPPTDRTASTATSLGIVPPPAECDGRDTRWGRWYRGRKALCGGDRTGSPGRISDHRARRVLRSSTTPLQKGNNNRVPQEERRPGRPGRTPEHALVGRLAAIAELSEPISESCSTTSTSSSPAPAS